MQHVIGAATHDVCHTHTFSLLGSQGLRFMQDVVYAFKPDQDAVVIISLCGSSYDTTLALYSRSNDWAALAEAGCNDDYCNTQSYLQVHPINLAALTAHCRTCPCNIKGMKEACCAKRCLM